MKIYIEYVTINKYKLDKLTPEKTVENNVFYTDSGLFKLNNGFFYKLEINDKPIRTIAIDNEPNKPSKLSIVIDNGFIDVKKDISYQLPINHIHNTYTTKIYKLTEKSPFRLYVNISNDKQEIQDWYFESKEDPEYFIEDINKFLSVIT